MFRNPFLLVVAVVLGLFALGLVLIGAFPPSVTPQTVERTIPNDRFRGR
jgi:hypothetical protein